MIHYIDDLIHYVLKHYEYNSSYLLVLLTHTGVHAMIFYSLSHSLYKRKLYCLSRMLSQLGRLFTRIEIHPGASIDRRFVIIGGVGTVIGETAVIGEECVLYDEVTLGNNGKGNYEGKRHPTLMNRVVIMSGAKILGNITIGDEVVISPQSVILKDQYK